MNLLALCVRDEIPNSNGKSKGGCATLSFKYLLGVFVSIRVFDTKPIRKFWAFAKTERERERERFITQYFLYRMRKTRKEFIAWKPKFSYKLDINEFRTREKRVRLFPILQNIKIDRYLRKILLYWYTHCNGFFTNQ